MRKQKELKPFAKEDLFTVKGTVNAAVTRRERFLNSELYKQIIKETEKYSEYNLSLGHKISIWSGKVQPKICPYCGKEYFEFSGYEYPFKICKCHVNYTQTSKEKFRQTKQQTKLTFVNTINEYIKQNKQPLYTINQIKQMKFNHKHVKFGNTNFDLCYSIVYHTSFIPFTINDYKINERIYVICHDIAEQQYHEIIKTKHFYAYTKGFVDNVPYKQRHKQDMYNAILSQGFEILEEIPFENKSTLHRMKLKCKKCGTTITPLVCCGYWRNIYCEGCYGKIGRSKKEDEIIEFIKSLDITNIRTNVNNILEDGKELDIYLPDYNLGIELCGILWHSYGKTHPNNFDLSHTTKKYHMYEKNQQALNVQVKLLSIYDIEWDLKKDIVKDIIKSKLNIYTNKIYGRNTICKQINDKDTSRNFLDSYHLQGSINDMNHSYGLYFNNELVAIGVIGKRNLGKQVKCELLRFCVKPGYCVIGGLSKIMKHICKSEDIDIITTYCDARYSTGNGYNKAGFKYSHYSKPNYYYFKENGILLSRIRFQKHKLKNILENFDETKTEVQNMIDNGYRILYDCGNYVYEWYADESMYIDKLLKMREELKKNKKVNY